MAADLIASIEECISTMECCRTLLGLVVAQRCPHGHNAARAEARLGTIKGDLARLRALRLLQA
ncbi:hypothetical protein [Methylobacterium sp. WSM2598]|uniref:hypothetical protein n=1 Tax=Methylobacterium sp. WSM2598 TaxID=398261 RepID=UPI00037399E2|nr:hypothetical protein [Methylobacterium sp. WSM2598]